MMSGLLPSRVGGYDNAPEFSAAIPTFAHYLRLAGYLTCLSGKMHFAGPDQLHGYEQRLTTDIYPSDFGWTPNWSEPDAKVTFQDMQNVLETGPCLRSLQIDYDDDVAIQADRWLFDRARDKHDQPFMLTVSFTSPHDPYVAQPEFWDLYQDDEIDLPTVPAFDPTQYDAHSARIFEHYSIGKASVSEKDLKRLRHGYYASIEYIDSKIKMLLRTLEDTGLDKNTIVVFASDHGDMMGERGLYYKKTFFEWSMRVPLIFWAPSRFKARRVSQPVSLLDLLPTFCELGEISDTVLESDGDSLLALITADHDGSRPDSDRIIAAEFLAEGVFEPTFMLRNNRYKLMYAENDPPLLYDMQEDPDELTNLASVSEHESVVRQLSELARDTWDTAALRSVIIRDQNRRRLIDQAHKRGKAPVWDYQPVVDASQQYVRAGKWTVEVEAGAHLGINTPDDIAKP